MFLIILAAALTLYGDLTDPPFAFVRKRKEVGFEVDLAKEIAARLDVELQFAKEGDLKVGGNESTCPYMQAPLAILVDTKKRPAMTCFADVKGRIGIQGIGREVAQKLGEVVDYPKERTIDAIVDLTEGRIDAFLKIKPAALYLSFASATLKIIGEVPDRVYPIGFVIGDHELEQQVARVQAQLVEEGIFDRIYRKWFGINDVMR